MNIICLNMCFDIFYYNQVFWIFFWKFRIFLQLDSKFWPEAFFKVQLTLSASHNFSCRQTFYNKNVGILVSLHPVWVTLLFLFFINHLGAQSVHNQNYHWLVLYFHPKVWGENQIQLISLACNKIYIIHSMYMKIHELVQNKLVLHMAKEFFNMTYSCGAVSILLRD